MIEEIKKQIRQRLEGFDIDMVHADVDSWIFGNKTILKIEELSNEFDMPLVIEVINAIYLEGSEISNNKPLKSTPATVLTSTLLKTLPCELVKIIHDSGISLSTGLGRSSRITTNQGSGGHGHDISINGGKHKKVITGKAGNRYPIPKKKGVR